MNQLTITSLTDAQKKWVVDQSKKRGLTASAVVKILIQDRIDLEANHRSTSEKIPTWEDSL